MQKSMKEILRCKENQKLYNQNDINSIFEYAKKIEKKTFIDILKDANKSEEDIEWVKSKETDKGLPGKIIEATYFGYELNNKQEPDFNDVEVELKTTPVDINKKKLKKNSTINIESIENFVPGETISITMLNFTKPLISEDIKDDNAIDAAIIDSFEKSHLYNKIKNLIVIFYYRNRNLTSKLNYEVKFARRFNISDDDLLIIKNDYKEIIKKIISGKEDELSRRDGIYLSTAPKATTSNNTIIKTYYGHKEIISRCYTFKKNFVNIILQNENDEKIVKDINELKNKSFEKILENKFSLYLGKNIDEIITNINSNGGNIVVKQNSKSNLAIITARILGLKKLSCSEFKKANIVVKTILFDKKNKNSQHFRLFDVDFDEINNCEKEYEFDENGDKYNDCNKGWENSELFKCLSDLKYLFIIFKKDENDKIIFKNTLLWGMPDNDIELAKSDWIEIKNVLNNGVILEHKNGKTYNNFPGVSKSKIIHIRPHANKSYYVDINGHKYGNGSESDSVKLSDGQRITRQSYWLKSKYIKNILKNKLD